MLMFKNEIGWRLHRYRRGYVVSQEHPPLRMRVRPFGPVALNILAAILVLLFHGRDGRFYGVFSAIPGSLLLGLWCFRPAILYINGICLASYNPHG